MKTRLLLSSCTVALIAASTASGAGGAKSHAVDMTWKIATLRHTGRPAAGNHARTSGAPFGKGTVYLKDTLDHYPIHATFWIHTAHGSVSGELVIKIKPVGSTTGDAITLRYSGTGKFTSGSGRYAGASGSVKKLTGKVTSTTTCSPTGQCTYREAGQLEVTGSVRY